VASIPANKGLVMRSWLEFNPIAFQSLNDPAKDPARNLHEELFFLHDINLAVLEDAHGHMERLVVNSVLRRIIFEPDKPSTHTAVCILVWINAARDVAVIWIRRLAVKLLEELFADEEHNLFA
jgi:hypothetical protein